MERPLGNLLFNLRKSRGLSFRKAASEIGISKVFLSELESGTKIPSAKTLAALSSFYGTDYRELEIAAKQQKVINNAIDSSDERLNAARTLITLSEDQFDEVLKILSSFDHDKIRKEVSNG